MQINIFRDNHSFIVRLDGVHIANALNAPVSRELTETYNEYGSGIFSKETAVWFERGASRVTVVFDEPFNCYTENLIEEIKKRILKVDQAFEKVGTPRLKTLEWEFTV